MKHPTHIFVQVGAATDETMASKYEGVAGVIIGHNTNKATGNTRKDPLHIVLFDDGHKESFWYEELIALSTNPPKK